MTKRKIENHEESTETLWIYLNGPVYSCLRVFIVGMFIFLIGGCCFGIWYFEVVEKVQNSLEEYATSRRIPSAQPEYDRLWSRLTATSKDNTFYTWKSPLIANPNRLSCLMGYASIKYSSMMTFEEIKYQYSNFLKSEGWEVLSATLFRTHQAYFALLDETNDHRVTTRVPQGINYVTLYSITLRFWEPASCEAATP